MYIFTKAVKSALLPVLILGITSSPLLAQQTKASSGDVAGDSVSISKKAKKDGPVVRGTITESATGKPLTGINVSVEGYSAAITNDNGSFSLSVPDKDAVLIVKGPGYQTKEIALKGRTSVKVSLYEETFNSVYDVAQLPSGKKALNHIPYAVTSINTYDNWQRVTESPDSYLQGKVSGLNAVRRSGTPGIGSNLFLQGFNSLYATNRPLIVVDGVIYDNNEYGTSIISGHINNPLQDIDLKDIDNITILKDAGAAVYGTRGANGVILITTARAKEQATRIDFAAYGGMNSKVSNVPLMDAGDYRVYLTDLLKTRGLSDLQIQQQPYMNDVVSPNPDYYRYHYNTNWQNQVMDNSYNQNYYLKVTGGDDIATYGLSLGYLKNNSITNNTDLTRYQTRFNADLNLSARFKATANLSFTTNEQNLKNQGIDYTNPLYLSLVKAPFLPVQSVGDNGEESPNLAESDIFNVSNPVSVTQNMEAFNNNYRFLGSLGFNYQFSKSASLQTLVGITFDKVREKMFIPDKGVISDTLSNAIAYNRSGSNVQRLFSIYNDTRFSYNHIFNGVHSLSANVGFRFNKSKSEDDYGLGYNSATDEFVSVSNGQAQLRRIGGNNGEWNWLNTYASADYEYMSKYLLSVNVALDGSSRFGKEAPDALNINGNPFAVMPSVAAGWLVSSEEFMSDVKLIESLKLRASYGLTGNDDIGNYNAKQYYISENFLGVQGLVRANIGNPGLQWETVKKADVGLDAAFLNERLRVNFDVFHNKTSNMLTYEPALTASGFDFVVTNNGAMSTKGMELALSARIINKALKWDMGVNLSTYKNKVTQVPNGRILNTYANATILTQVGSEANLFYGFKTNGVYTTDAEAAGAGLKYLNANGDSTIAFHGGDVRFVDTNGDHVINDDDRQVIGNPNPDFTGGFNNTISFKRWSFNALFTFSKGNDVYNYTRSYLESMNGYQNQTLDVINRWRVNGQTTDVPRAVWGDPAGNSRFSDRWIEDGSYLRLRTLSVAYNVPFKNKALKYATVYLTGNNVFTLSKYLGYDPEFSSTGSIFGQGIDTGVEPQFRTVQLGVRIGL